MVSSWEVVCDRGSGWLRGWPPGCVAGTGPLWRWSPCTPRGRGQRRGTGARRGASCSAPSAPVTVKAQHCAQCKEQCLPTPAHCYSQCWRMNAELRGGTLGDNGLSVRWCCSTPSSSLGPRFAQSETKALHGQAPLLLWRHLICHLPCRLCGGHPDLPAVSGTYLVGAWPQGLHTRWLSLANSFPS